MNNENNKIPRIEDRFVKTKEFTKRNQWNQLNKLIEQGLITKVKRGIYYKEANTMIDQTVEVSQIVPSGVFCLFTAWQHYNLSTQNPPDFHIALRNKEKIRLPDYPPIKLYYWSEKYYNLGIAEIEKDRQTIKIYDLEKSVCDAVRFRNKVGMDTTIEILQNYVKRKDKNLNKLNEYAQQLGVGNIVQNMIMTLL